MRQEIKDKLMQKATEIQPDKKYEDHTKGWSEQDKILYLKMVEIYNDLCKDDVTFCLNFVTSDGYHPMLFWRICELSQEDRYRKAGGQMFFSMYKMLFYSGYLKNLEKEGYLVLTDKLKMKTRAEELNIKD